MSSSNAVVSPEAPAAHVYRAATLLGRALQETLDEMLNEDAVSSECALRLVHAFDVAMRDALRAAASDSLCVSVGSGTLDEYRYVDDVWSLVLRNVQLTLYETPLVPTNMCSARCKVVVCTRDFDETSAHGDEGGDQWLGSGKRARWFT